MSLKVALLLAGFGSLVGVALGYFLRLIISLGKKGSVELEIKQMMLEAKEEAKKITAEAEGKANETVQEARLEVREKDEKLKQTENRLIKKEDLLDKRQVDLDKEVEEIKVKITEIKEIREKAVKLEGDRKDALERISGLKQDEAKAELFRVLEQKFEEDIMNRLRKIETTGQEKLERRAKDILSTTIQRLASSVAGDVMSTSVPIPSDDIKGKIIGKEGRNIKAFERMTGVEVIVDDTPGTITISSFDPVRRQVARMALEELIKDGSSGRHVWGFNIYPEGRLDFVSLINIRPAQGNRSMELEDEALAEIKKEDFPLSEGDCPPCCAKCAGGTVRFGIMLRSRFKEPCFHVLYYQEGNSKMGRSQEANRSWHPLKPCYNSLIINKTRLTMQITPEIIKRTAELSRIALTAGEQANLGRELTGILNHIDELQQVNTKTVEPTNQVTNLNNMYRDDIVKPYDNVAGLLAGAHEVVENYIKVKQVLP